MEAGGIDSKMKKTKRALENDQVKEDDGDGQGERSPPYRRSYSKPIRVKICRMG